MQINKTVLSEIANRSDTSESVFRILRARVRDPKDGVFKLSVLKEVMKEQGMNPQPQEVLSTFKELERAGIGKLEGDVFSWKESLKRVAEAAGVPAKKPLPKGVEVQHRCLVICLDNTRRFEASFPSNMTPEEIDEAVEFLRRKMS